MSAVHSEVSSVRCVLVMPVLKICLYWWHRRLIWPSSFESHGTTTWGRDRFVFAPSQWETTLHCNVVSHWLGAYTKWSLRGRQPVGLLSIGGLFSQSDNAPWNNANARCAVTVSPLASISPRVRAYGCYMPSSAAAKFQSKQWKNSWRWNSMTTIYKLLVISMV